jgi:hypothetical protein
VRCAKQNSDLADTTLTLTGRYNPKLASNKRVLQHPGTRWKLSPRTSNPPVADLTPCDYMCMHTDDTPDLEGVVKAISHISTRELGGGYKRRLTSAAQT